MRKLFLTLLFAVMAVASYAQKVELTVVDAATKEGVAGAVVDLTEVDKAENSKQAISAYAGKTTLQGVKNGTYTLTIQFIGYETLSQEVTISGKSRQLGTFELKEEATKLETVTLEVQAMRASTKGDTISYTARMPAPFTAGSSSICCRSSPTRTSPCTSARSSPRGAARAKS